MEIKITKTNGVRFKVWIDEWDTEFDTLHDERRFCSYTITNNPDKKSRIEVILVETLTWDGEHGTYKDHILASFSYKRAMELAEKFYKLLNKEN